MVDKKWGAQSDVVVEAADDVSLAKMLPDYCQDELKARARVDSINQLNPWILRPKTVTEKQRGTLQYGPNGAVHIRTKLKLAWKIILLLATVALVCFYGVGIIATNTTFAPLYKKYFFWIAIGWSLISSALLMWLVIALGASTRDFVGVFLTGLGLWLVVIQIGQTHLLTQAQDGSNLVQ
ncbi:uncharacterized protein LTR77_005113 [Saxophila tyrrhenica]|uniref:Uncharacterized protein n=1 Tax=Saxophila tyrrhenica TaxID=1690608 RepID=A0AAV9PEA6_9PEZI|nr:hypothetical protein LTR77_005113 [Saxophila tyrrhenica]